MTQYLFSDSCYGTLAASVASGATAASVITVQGTFPTPTSGEAFTVVFNPALSGLPNNTTTEEVTVTTNSSGEFTCSALAHNHSVGENVALVVTSAVLNNFLQGPNSASATPSFGDIMEYTSNGVWTNIPHQFNVKAWGATGNGTTDDTAAIQAVLNYVTTGAASVYGGTVFFPPGNYKITSTLTITGQLGIGVDLLGAGSTKATLLSYIVGTSSSVAPTPTLSWHNPTLNANSGGLPTITGGIQGITIDGLNTQGNVTGFDFGDVVGLNLLDFQVQNFYGGTIASGYGPHLSNTVKLTSATNTFNDTTAVSEDVGKQVTIYSVTPNGASVTVQESLGYVVSNTPGTSTTVSGMPTFAGGPASVVVDYAFNAAGIVMNNQYAYTEESKWWEVFAINNRVNLHITRTYRTDTGITLDSGKSTFADANATTADINKAVTSTTHGLLPGYITNVASGSVTMSQAWTAGYNGANTLQIGGANSWDYTNIGGLRLLGNNRQVGVLVDNGMFSYGSIIHITGNFGYQNNTTPFFWVTAGATSTNVTAIRGATCHIAIENDAGTTGTDFQVDTGHSLILNGNIQISNFGSSNINGTFNYTGTIISPTYPYGGVTGAESTSAGGVLTSSIGIDTNGFVSPGSNGLNGVNGNIWFGTGVPSASLGANGDYYFRVDGSTTTHLYFNSSGSWAGII